MAADRRLANDGLRYWAPGPVAGTLWALDEDSTPQLLSEDGGKAPKESRERFKALARASDDPERQLVFLVGGYAYGIAVPFRDAHTHPKWRWDQAADDIDAGAGCWKVVPFDFQVKVVHVEFDGRNMSRDLSWPGCPTPPERHW